MIGWLKRIFRPDPVQHCTTYKNEGCAHVDGYLCEAPTCLPERQASLGLLQDDPATDAPKRCDTCRFWSERMAMFISGDLCAVCLRDGQFCGKYTPGGFACTAWRSGHDGAIDSPKKDPSRY